MAASRHAVPAFFHRRLPPAGYRSPQSIHASGAPRAAPFAEWESDSWTPAIRSGKDACKASWRPLPGRPATTPPPRAHVDVERAAASDLAAAERRAAHGGPGGKREKLPVWIVPAVTKEELLAAAALRAQLFYEYPAYLAGGGAANAEEEARDWEEHELRLAELRSIRTISEAKRDSKMFLLGMKATCLLALCEQKAVMAAAGPPPGGREAALLRSRVEALPEVPCRPDGCPGAKGEAMVAVGTLDVQDGTGAEPHVDVNRVLYDLVQQANPVSPSGQKRVPLPVIRLRGEKRLVSSAANPEERRAYIFNLCVSEFSRRQGVATALLDAAMRLAAETGLDVLYVHVDVDNDAAVEMYRGLGFATMQVEDESVRRRLHRCSRILMSYRLT